MNITIDIQTNQNEEQQVRSEACSKEVAEVLNKYNCTMLATITIAEGGGLIARKVIVSRPSKIINPDNQ